MAKRPRVPPPFSFPRQPHLRVHGPRGHASYQAYKPWLRDEFEFRCVYCLTRERWRDDGYYGFTVDHVKPKSVNVELSCDYDNLVYACARCNTLKSVKLGLPDPCETTLALHLKHRSGFFIPLTPLGKRLIAYLKLNSRERVDNRRRYLMLFEKQSSLSQEDLLLTFGYPAELPNLGRLRPPGGNSRLSGVNACHYARAMSGKLSETIP